MNAIRLAASAPPWSSQLKTAAWLQRIAVRTLLVSAVIAALALVPSSLLYVRDSLDPGLVLYKDFGQEYLLARAVADGVDPYVSIRDLATRYLSPVGLMDKDFATPHPPTVGLLMMPMALLDYVTAVRVWFALQVVSLVLGIFLALRSADIRSKRLWVAGSIVALGWAPAVVDLSMGQLTLPMLALLAGSLVAFRTGRNRVGGALLAAALLLKPLAWPWLLFLVWRRMWSALITLLAVAGSALVLTALRVGFYPLINYFTRVLPSVSAQYATETSNISLWTLGPRVFDGTRSGLLAGMPPVVAVPALGQLIGLLVPLLVLVAAIAWIVWDRPSLAPALGVLTGVGILVNPISWDYYLVLMLIPLAQLVRALRMQGFARVPSGLALGAVVALYLTDQSWYAIAVAIGASVADKPTLVSLTGLLTLGPACAVGALTLMLAYLSHPRRRARV